MCENRKYSGFLLMELTVSLTVLGILLACLALSLNGFRRFNHYQLVRQHCISAAQAQLDSIAITGKSIHEKHFKRLWPELSVLVQESAASGQWEGMKLVKVRTKGKSFNKEVEIELCRYILAEKRQ